MCGRGGRECVCVREREGVCVYETMMYSIESLLNPR